MANGDTYVGTDNPVPATSPDSLVSGGGQLNQGPELVGKEPGPDQDVNDPKLSAGDQMLQYLHGKLEQDRKRAAEEDTELQSLKSMSSMLAAQLKTPLPQKPQYQPYPPLPGQQPQKGDIGQFMMQVASIIAIGSAVFGRSRNPYSRMVQEASIGGFLSGIAQGRKDTAQAAMENWNKAVELADKRNREETQDYKDALANAHLSLQEQTQVIRSITEVRRDTEMYLAAARQDLDKINQLVKDKEKAITATNRAQIDAVSKAHKWLGTEQGKTWSQWVEEQPGGVNPYSSEENYHKMTQKFPPSTWIDSQKQFGKTTPPSSSGGKLVPGHLFGPADVYPGTQTPSSGTDNEPSGDQPNKKDFEDMGID